LRRKRPAATAPVAVQPERRWPEAAE